MPKVDSTSSTEKQADFLDGALRRDSIEHWVQQQFPDISNQTQGAEPLFDFDFGNAPSTAHAFLLGTIFAHETEERTHDPRSLFTRIICHLFVSKMPEQGMPELCTSLQDIYSFYQSPIQSNQTLITQREKISAKLGAAYERPEFQIEGE